jgi:hypothetical protein
MYSILKKAEVNLIQGNKLFRLLRANEFDKQPIDTMDRIIYEVQMVNGSFRIVSFAQMFDLVGDEELTNGDTHCLSDLGQLDDNDTF